MITYLIKRLLLFIPTLLAVAIISFFLSKIAPGDPVEEFLNPNYSVRDYQREAIRLGLDKPAFYFRLTNAAVPDTLHRILPAFKRQNLERLIGQTGNWPEIQKYSNVLYTLESQLTIPFDSITPPGFSAFAGYLRALRRTNDTADIRHNLALAAVPLASDSLLSARYKAGTDSLTNALDQLRKNATTHLLWMPKFTWYGLDNQFHRWISGFVCGDFGISYQDQRPVASRIGDAIFWTIVINLTAILLAFLIAIPIGVWAAEHQNSRFDKTATLLLFMLYSLPVFWIATMLLVFFTTPEYGMDLFPSIGLGDPVSKSKGFTLFMERASHLVLPVFCLTYPALAFVSRQMRTAMVQELNKEYIRTARAKGLSQKQVIWKHAFRNSLFPIITLFSSVFPATIAGSVVIEVIFNIPGMGKLMVDAILQRDWPVVYTVLMLGSVLTLAGMLVADVLYSLADPRVRFQQK